ncbi:MAG: hypothetical protein V2A79_00430 [Planctomycetota bacterium]
MTSPKIETSFTFDCVAYKRKVQEQIYEATKDLSPQEELAYYRDRAENGPLGSWWQSVMRRPKETGGCRPPQVAHEK